MDFIAIDFETATPERHSPCEIGLTFVENGEIKETKSWLVKPPSYPHFDSFNIRIHGIQPDDVKDHRHFQSFGTNCGKYYLANLSWHIMQVLILASFGEL